MSRKLSRANPYLRNPEQRERTLLQSVASSSAIEGIHAPFRKPATGTVRIPSSKTVKSGIKR